MYIIKKDILPLQSHYLQFFFDLEFLQYILTLYT